jgi:hypothetical protein
MEGMSSIIAAEEPDTSPYVITHQMRTHPLYGERIGEEIIRTDKDFDERGRIEWRRGG